MTITASVSRTQTLASPVLPVLVLLGQCLFSPYTLNDLFSTALVCASLLLRSGFKSTQFVLFLIDYFMCFFVLPLKLSESIIIFKALFINIIFLNVMIWHHFRAVDAVFANILSCLFLALNADGSFI